MARIRSKKLARSAQSCTCRSSLCARLVSSPATFSTSPFSGGPNARQYGPKKQTGSSAVVWRASGAKNQRGRRKGAPAGGLDAPASFPHLLLLAPPLFLADRTSGSRPLKNRQAHQLWCGAHPEQKISAVGAKVHLQVLSQPNTTTSAVQIVYFAFSKI